MIIRPFAAQDLQAVLALWNPIIRDTTISFTSEERTPVSMLELVEDRRAKGHEFFVAHEDRVLGIATYAQFRGGNGYRHAMEHTILVDPKSKGCGIGRLLMLAVEDHARKAGHHTMHAGVSAENLAGVAFHAAVGYCTIATIPEVGRKFDRWLDLVLMQKIL
jgi:L-amino acid N-acyltransferase